MVGGFANGRAIWLLVDAILGGQGDWLSRLAVFGIGSGGFL